jgi:hypothetical protein
MPNTRDEVGPARSFKCHGCHEVDYIYSTGRFPTHCSRCRPTEAWIRLRNAQNGILACRERIALLESMLCEIDDLGRELGPPSKATVHRAVVRVAHAQGAQETARALKGLSAAADAWAVLLLTSSMVEKGVDQSLRESLA